MLELEVANTAFRDAALMGWLRGLMCECGLVCWVEVEVFGRVA